jgi:hypothetical protein
MLPTRARARAVRALLAPTPKPKVRATDDHTFVLHLLCDPSCRQRSVHGVLVQRIHSQYGIDRVPLVSIVSSAAANVTRCPALMSFCERNVCGSCFIAAAPLAGRALCRTRTTRGFCSRTPTRPPTRRPSSVSRPLMRLLSLSGFFLTVHPFWQILALSACAYNRGNAHPGASIGTTVSRVVLFLGSCLLSSLHLRLQTFSADPAFRTTRSGVSLSSASDCALTSNSRLLRLQPAPAFVSRLRRACCFCSLL